jgi:hypothetical protein
VLNGDIKLADFLPHSLAEFDRRFGEVFVVNIFYLQLREYINEWRKQRGKEEEELKRLKDKQAKRKEIRYSKRYKISGRIRF